MIQPLVETLRTKVPMLVRSAPSTGEYLEGVLSRNDLQQCYALLTETFGGPVKEFGRAAKFEPAIQQAIHRFGGIWVDQCLFLKQGEAGQMAYAALWPWASDPGRLTLKVGLIAAAK